ncbi:unnamed protein product (macronuclear) [Paramecium tetraurelia]|uniref:non-specific serine/threonine protein kinase n=1 Tax=Paramecium tetraurelia TaxID=5888 RepID=A0D8U8_PARTE|nr:uncharacterized protein GSPATT00014411001 [Paramecium tetraurelia]CAK79465.1 unnamed protein product [Paramecium tetraurelia]|eukprot:XP_001446862.1 hypothetical protein (macronuclear) [Paramecium tetraurelia strain d4-2]
MQNYQILEKIYESKSTIIHKVRNIKDNNTYAMKEFVGFYNQALSEIQIMKKCQIPFVIKLKEVFRLDDNVIIIMEYADQGNLKQFISEHLGSFISERVICKILIQIMFVLIYLRENKICYKGLNPENILIHQEQVRICDFGIDNLIQHQKPSYRPPELLFQNNFTYKSMMYQFGLVLYELTTQRQLFKSEIIEQIKAVILNGGAIVKIPSMYSKELRFIITTCLDLQETGRFDIRELVHNENFKILLKQKHFTFTYEQQDTFEFWCNSKQQKQNRKSVFTDNLDLEAKEPNSNGNDQQIIQQDKPNNNKTINIESKNRSNLIIPKLNQQTLNETLTVRPISQQTKGTQSNTIIRSNTFSRQNFPSFTNRKLLSPKPKPQFIDFIQKPQYLDAPTKPQNAINNLIKLKMEQCVETIGIEETRQTLNRLKQGGSLKEFISKYQDAKHYCIARHMQDIISFTQL